MWSASLTTSDNQATFLNTATRSRTQNGYFCDGLLRMRGRRQCFYLSEMESSRAGGRLQSRVYLCDCDGGSATMRYYWYLLSSACQGFPTATGASDVGHPRNGVRRVEASWLFQCLNLFLYCRIMKDSILQTPFFVTVVNYFASSSTQRMKHSRKTKRRVKEFHWFRGSTLSLYLRIDMMWN